MPLMNASDIKKYLRGFADFQDAGLQQKLGGHLIAALSGPLKVRNANLSVITAPQKNWPELLKEKFNTRADSWLLFRPDAALDDKIRHIADWIKAAMVNDEPWLRDTDRDNVPLILRSIKSLDQATEMADAAMMLTDEQMQIAQKQWIGKDEEAGGHITLEMPLSDGSRIVRLLTPEALDRESGFLGHCIGKGSYDDQLKGNQWAFYSLRDALNKPHATFAVNLETNTLEQCKGAQNTPPVEKYFPAVQEFVRARRYHLNESAGHTGLLLQDGVYYNVFNLPKGLACKTSLDLWQTKRCFSLPDNLSVTDYLCLGGCTGLAALPDNLSVTGNLNLQDCTSLTALPDNLSVTGHLNLIGCTSLTILPDNLSVTNYLHLEGCTGLTALPDNLSVTGDLYLKGCTGLRELPQDLKVGGWIVTDMGSFSSVAKASAAFREKFSRENLSALQKQVLTI